MNAYLIDIIKSPLVLGLLGHGNLSLPLLGLQSGQMKPVTLFLALAFATVYLAQDHPKNTMCVKQKDGTYKCLASGKIEKKPCCDLGTDPAHTSKAKKK